MFFTDIGIYTVILSGLINVVIVIVIIIFGLHLVPVIHRKA